MVDRSGSWFGQRSCPMKVLDVDKPGWMVRGGRAQLFAIVPSGVVQLKPAALIDPLG